MTGRPRPPYDPELVAVLASLRDQVPTTVTPDMVEDLRRVPLTVPIDDLLDAAGVTRRDITVPGFDGAEIEVSVLRRRGRTGLGPGVLHAHPGGMVIGNRMTGVRQLVDWIVRLDAVVVTVEYRLAPEFPDPYPVEDCYAGLLWTAQNLAPLEIDPDRLIVAGSSAGGGLAAGVALLARDRGGPALAGQVLMCPMLDDRDVTVSTAQYDGVGIWDRTSNRTGWGALLGARRGTEAVSCYAAPARATDLAGLPPAYIDCGSAEVFRDEDVAYATALWEAGVQAELHVWPGGFHGFDLLAPRSALGLAMAEVRTEGVARLLGRRGDGEAPFNR